VICDNALLSGYAADVKPIGGDIIEEVCREFDLPRRSGVAPESVAAQIVEPTPAVETQPAGSEAPKAVSEPVGVASKPAPGTPKAADPSGHAAPVTTLRAIEPAPASPKLESADLMGRGVVTSAASAPVTAAVQAPSAAGAADQDLFSNYGKSRRFSLLGWVRG
jgi:hypothetical protein